MALVAPVLLVATSASATLRHGATALKVCVPENTLSGTTDVGQPYVCSYGIEDTDQFKDGITVSDIDDVIETSGGAVDSGNILSKLQLTFDSSAAGSPSCTGGSGLGTTASPYIGATLCTVPYNAEIETNIITSFYNVAPLDYNLPGSQLNDTVTFTWQSLCSSPGGSGMSCPVGNQTTTTGGSVLVQQLTADTSTKVLNSSDTPVTTVAVGTAVHDSVTVVPDGDRPDADTDDHRKCDHQLVHERRLFGHSQFEQQSPDAPGQRRGGRHRFQLHTHHSGPVQLPGHLQR